jgi:hypothetical protein
MTVNDSEERDRRTEGTEEKKQTTERERGKERISLHCRNVNI